MIWFMEELLRIEANIKYFVGMGDRSYQRWLMDELLKILEDAEFLFGPRDRSYELLEPRITERAFGQAFEVSPRKMRIYLTSRAKTRSMVISRIDEKSLVDVAGVEPDLARILCADFETYYGKTATWHHACLVNQDCEPDSCFFIRGNRSIFTAGR